jgi:hypothetical protein
LPFYNTEIDNKGGQAGLIGFGEDFFLDWTDTVEIVDEEIRTFMYSLAH